MMTEIIYISYISGIILAVRSSFVHILISTTTSLYANKTLQYLIYWTSCLARPETYWLLSHTVKSILHDKK